MGILTGQNKGKEKGVKTVPGKIMCFISSMSPFASLSEGTVKQNSPCFALGKLQEGLQHSRWSDLSHSCRGDASCLSQAAVFTGERGLSPVGAPYWRAVTASLGSWKTCLAHIPEVTVWKCGCETSWSGEQFSQGLFPYTSGVLTLIFQNAGNSAGLNFRGRVGNSCTIFLEKGQLMCIAITHSVNCTAQLQPVQGDGFPSPQLTWKICACSHVLETHDLKHMTVHLGTDKNSNFPYCLD